MSTSRFDEVLALVAQDKWDGERADRMGFGFTPSGEIPADEADRASRAWGGAASPHLGRGRHSAARAAGLLFV